MKSVFLSVFALLATQSAFAANDAYKCFNVGGVDEWTLEFNMTSKKAAFFDNDSWSIVPLTRSMVLESIPPQSMYVFSGKDAYGSPVEIWFNVTRLKATVVENPNTSNSKRYQSEGCQAVPASKLYSKI